MAYASWSVIAGEQPTAAKWNILGTNDASFNDGTGIGTSTITPEKLLAGTGATNWVWSAWSPTFSNWTIGTGGSAGTTAKYTQIGKAVHFRIKSTLGTSGQSVGSNATFTLPISANAEYTVPFAIGTLYDSNNDVGWISFATSNTGQLIFGTAGGVYVGASGTGVSTPFSWAAGSYFTAVGTYEAA